MKVSLDVTDWCDLFAEVSTTSSAVFWMTQINRKTQQYEQRYLSDNYEQLTGHPKAAMFNDISIFTDYLVSDNKHELTTTWVSRHDEQTPTSVSVYALKKADGNVIWMRDKFYTIYDKAQPVLAAGIALDITDRVNSRSDKRTIMQQAAHEEAHYNDCLYQKLGISLLKLPDVALIKLPQREQQCADMLAEGMTSKQIASRLFLSTRTVEVYFDRLKKRLGAKNKMHLVKLLADAALI